MGIMEKTIGTIINNSSSDFLSDYSGLYRGYIRMIERGIPEPTR